MLRRLSEFVWCPGRTAEARAFGSGRGRFAREPAAEPRARQGVRQPRARLAGPQPARRKRSPGARRALELAERLDDDEIAVHALATIGVNQFAANGPEELEQLLERAQSAALAEQVGRIFVLLAGAAVSARRQTVASRHLERGSTTAAIEVWSSSGSTCSHSAHALSSTRAAGRRQPTSAATVLRIPRTSTTPRIHALVVLGLVRARRGDPGQWAALDEAWALAEPTGELHRLGPVAAARAEAAWLEGRGEAVIEATDAALELAPAARAPVGGRGACRLAQARWRR